METFPEDLFETVGKARIVSGDEIEVVGGVYGELEGLGWRRPRNSCFWMRGTG